MFPWGRFPFNDDFKAMSEHMNPSDIQAYVSEMINRYIPPTWENTDPNFTSRPFQQKSKHEETQEKTLHADVFETFKHVYIRVGIPNEEQLKKIKIFHTSNQAILRNVLEDGDKHIITLPCLVKRKGAAAVAKDGILEIKIPKNIDMQYTEVDLTEEL